MLNWTWKDWGSGYRPQLKPTSPVFTMTFYITGTGNLVGDYSWLECSPTHWGKVGEISGTWYKITATAKRPIDNKTIAVIMTDVMDQAGAIRIMSWRISN